MKGLLCSYLKGGDCPLVPLNREFNKKLKISLLFFFCLVFSEGLQAQCPIQPYNVSVTTTPADCGGWNGTFTVCLDNYASLGANWQSNWEGYENIISWSDCPNNCQTFTDEEPGTFNIVVRKKGETNPACYVYKQVTIGEDCSTSCSNITNGGQIGSNQSDCGPSFDPATLTNISSPSGGSGAIEYIWLSSTSGCPNNVNLAIAGATGATYDPGPVSQTTYFRRCSRRAGCTNWVGESNCVVVEVLPSPTANAGANQTICSGESTTISATAFGGSGSGYSYTWSDGLGAGQSHSVSPNATETYRVTVTDSNGCTDTDRVKIFIDLDCTTCDNVTSGGQIGYDQEGCSPFDPVAFVNVTSPSGGSGNLEYLWLSSTSGCPNNVNLAIAGATGATYDPGPVSQTTYFRRCSRRAGCTDWVGESNCIKVTVHPSPTANAGPNQTICQGGSAVISATATGGSGYTYVWNQGLGAGQSHSVSPTGTTDYKVTVTDSNGCTSTDNVKIFIDLDCTTCDNVTSGGTIGYDQEACGSSYDPDPFVNITSPSGGSGVVEYIWLSSTSGCPDAVSQAIPGATGATYDSGPISETTWFSRYSRREGCYYWTGGSNCVLVTLNPGVAVNAGTDQTICLGESADISASASGGDSNYSYAWSQGLGGGQAHTVSPTVSKNYKVTVTDGNGCSATDRVRVNVTVVNANAGSNQTICEGNSATLTASGGGTYVWSTGATTASIVVAPGSTTTYTVTVTNNGCTDTDNVTVNVSPGVNANAGADQSICAGGSATLTASGGTDYKWSTGETTASITVSPVVTTNYIVTVSDGSGCSGTDVVRVSVNSINADAGPDQTICPGETATLTASGGTSYEWDTGETTASINVGPGDYMVTVSDDNGCTDEDKVSVIADPNGPGCTGYVDLEVSKSASSPTFEQGDHVFFTVTITNVGTVAAENVVVADAKPTGVAYGGYTATQGVYSDWFGTWDIGTIEPGATHTLTLDWYMQQGTNSITNFAQVETATPDDIDSTPGNNTSGVPSEDDEAAVTVTPPGGGDPSANLNLDKSVSQNLVENGDQIYYTIKVGNTGPDAATDVSVEDVLPAGLSFVSASASTGSYNAATGIWTIGGMANGAIEELTINVTVTNIGNGITNFAQIETANPDDPNSTPGNDTDNIPDEDDEDDVTITPLGSTPYVDLELSKTASTLYFSQYDIVFFTVTIVNNGTATANNVVVKDPKPAGVAYAGYTASKGTYSDWSGTWTIGTLASGESHTLELEWFMQQGTNPITNFAQVQTANPDDIDSTPGNNITNVPNEDDEASVTILPQGADPCLAYTCNATVTSQITMMGSCDGEATAGAANGTAPFSYSWSNGATTQTIGNLCAGTYTVTITDDNNCVCTANVTLNDADPGPICETRTVVNSQACQAFGFDYAFYSADLFTGVTAGVDYVVQNGTFTEYANGTARLLATFVNNDNPNVSFEADVIFTGRSFSPPANSPNLETCGNSYVPDPSDWYYYADFNGTLIGQGEIAGLVLDVYIIEHAFQIGTGANLSDEFLYGAAAWMDYTVVTPPNNSNITINANSRTDFNFRLTGDDLTCIDLSLDKTASVSQAVVGDQFVYTLTVSNDGPGDAYDVSVEDVLPAGLSYSSSSATQGTYNSSNSIWTVGTLANGASAELDITVTVNAISGSITNFAQVQTATPDDYDSTPGNDTNNTPDEDDEAEVTITEGSSCDPLTSAGQIGSDETGCGPSFDPAPITSISLPSGGSGAIEYQWLVSTVGCPSSTNAYQIIPGATGPTYDPGPITQTSYFRRCARRAGCSSFGPGESNCVTKTVENCGGNEIDLELTKTANTATFEQFDRVLFTVTIVNNGTDTATGVTVADAKPAGVAFVSAVASQGTYSDWFGLWTVGTHAPGQSETLVLEWFMQQEINPITNFAQVQSADQADTDSTPGNNTTGVPGEDDEAAVTVTPGSGGCDNVTDAGEIGYDQSGCGPFDPTEIVSVSLPSGGSGAIEYQWLSSTAGCPDNINQAIAGANGPTYDPGSLTETTYFRRCSRRAGCTDWVGESNCVIITVEDCGGGCDNVTDAGEIGYDETGCGPSFDPAEIVSVSSPSGGSGALEYLWLSSTSGCPNSVSQAIPGANGPTYDPGPITETTYFRRCVRRADCALWNESNCVVKTVENCGGSGIDLEVTKTADSPTFEKFDKVKFTVTIVNNGPQTATGVTVADAKPFGRSICKCRCKPRFL